MENWRPDISDPDVAVDLPSRVSPYFKLLKHCRHIGLEVKPDRTGYWVARVRRSDKRYMQRRVGMAFKDKATLVGFEQACERAVEWFETLEIRKVAAPDYEVGHKRQLSICPIGTVHTVGHALRDYLEWKQIAARRSHFETLVSLSNYHIVPRISQVPVQDFNGTHFHRFVLSVMQTPPKRGRVDPPGQIELREMSEEQLRKRKKTVNALISILRGAFELAWEHGHIDNDRPARCLRRLPNVDRPRVIFLTRAECHRLLQACDPNIEKLVLAGLYTGCRIKELIAMEARDFSQEERSIFVSNPKGNGPRYVLLPTEGVQFFAENCKGKLPSERIFKKQNGRVWSGEYKSYFQRAREKAGFSSEVTFHGLRHTYASQLLENGASLLTVADQLGHADVQTVSNTYGHLTNKFRARDVEQCFAPILSAADERQQEASDPPVFKHRPYSSWPRSNFSKFSGQLLTELSRSKSNHSV